MKAAADKRLMLGCVEVSKLGKNEGSEKPSEDASEEVSDTLSSLEGMTGIGALADVGTDFKVKSESECLQKVTLLLTQSINRLCWVSQSSPSTA